MLHRRIFGLLSREIRGLHQAAYLLATLSLCSSLLGFVRDRLLAHYYGADAALDLYYAAFRVPDFLFATVCSLLSVYVLVPFIEERMVDGREAVRQLLSELLTAFAAVMLVASLCAFLFSEQLTAWLFPGIQGAAQDTLVLYTRILLIQPFILGLSNLSGAIVQTNRRFLLFALSPILYNLGILVGILWFARAWGTLGLIYGVLLGAVMHLAIQLPYLAQSGLIPGFTVVRDVTLLIRVAAVSLPRTLALSFQQLTMVALTAQATLFAAGSVSVFMFAWNLQAVPVAVIAAAYSVAAFPTLSRYHAAGDLTSFVAHASTALRHILFWCIPIFALAFVIRAQLVRVLLGSGAFDWQDTMLTAALFAVFLSSLWAQGVSMLLMRAWYAAGRTWLPLFAAALAAATTMALVLLPAVTQSDSAVLTMAQKALHVDALAGNEVLGLALAYTIGTWVSALVLLAAFAATFGLLRSLWPVVWQSSVASVTGGMAAYAALQLYAPVLRPDTLWTVLGQGAAGGMVGLALWLLMLWLLDSRELYDTVQALSVRVWKRKVLIGGADSA